MSMFPVLTALLLWSATTVVAEPCTPAAVRSAARSEIKAFFDERRLQTLTFMGYSGAEYQDPAAMLVLAGQILDKYAPQKTMVIIGATGEGIGAVYDLAKSKGFTTVGIVSSQAKVNNVPFSSCVDHVFVVESDMGRHRRKDEAPLADIRRDGGEQRRDVGVRRRRHHSRRVDGRQACGEAD